MVMDLFMSLILVWCNCHVFLLSFTMAIVTAHKALKTASTLLFAFSPAFMTALFTCAALQFCQCFTMSHHFSAVAARLIVG